MALNAAFCCGLLLLYLTCCQVLTKSVEEFDDGEIDDDDDHFKELLGEAIRRGIDETEIDQNEEPPQNEEIDEEAGIDETEIDQNEGVGEELEAPGDDNDDEDKKQMTEVEINEMLGYKDDEMLLSNRQKKRGVGNTRTLWSKVNGKLHIPYVIDSSISSSNRIKITNFIAQMNSYIKCNTGTWKPRTSSDRHYVRFRNSGGCSSYLGVVRFRDPLDSSKTYQPINLASGCITANTGTVLHEMLHAMGFSHEQSRSDRDTYVTINFGNIQNGRQNNFLKLSKMVDASKNSPYDYGSVMHYPRKAFSKNGGDTIVPKQSVPIGQRNGMSATDKAELNAVYRCSTITPPTTRRRRRRRRWWGKK